MHQLQSALGHQKQWGGKLGAILVQKGFCREEQVVTALSEHLGMPAVRLSQVKVDPRAVKMVSKSVAERLHVFAYEVSGSGRSEVITIAMSDPTDLSAVDQLAFHTGKRIKPMLAGDSEVLAFIQQYYAPEKPAEEPRTPTAPGMRPFVDGVKPPAMAVAKPPAPPPPPQPPSEQSSAAPEADQGAADVEALALEGDDLPADAPMDGLEPIAAHTQGETSIETADAVAAPDGSSDEPVPLEDPSALQGWAEGTQQEGLTLETANPVVPAAPPESGWTEAQQGPDPGWPAAPGAPANDWGEPTVAPASAQGPDELPIDAIMGTADVLEHPSDDAPVSVDTANSADGAPVPIDGASSLDAPEAWSDISDPLAAAGGGAAQGSEGSDLEAAVDAADSTPAEPESQDGARLDPEWQAAAAAIEAAAEEEQRSDASDEPAIPDEEQVVDDSPAPLDDSPAPVHDVSIDLEGWSDDSTVPPPADEGAGFSMSSPAEEPQGDEDAEESFDIDTQDGGEAERFADEEERPATQRYGWLLRDRRQTEETAPEYGGDDAAPEGQQQEGYEEQPAYGDAASAYGEEQSGYGEQQESEPGEGWTAPAEPDAQSGAWFGEALSSTMPLSPADLGTLASLGLDPADAAAAQRMLACLVRVLNRRQAIDLEELAAEIRESRMAAEAQITGEEQPLTDETAADPDASAEPADDPA